MIDDEVDRQGVRVGAIRLAVLFHDTYERLAPKYGYETKPDTKIFKAFTPNGKLMIAVCREIKEVLNGVKG